MRHTPQAPLAQRLFREMAAQLAARVGCCPIHGTHQLICAFCDVTTCGSAAEHLEMDALLDRAEVSRMPCPTWPCARCGTKDSALCLDCYEPVREQAFAGLTPAEAERLQVLCQRSMRYTFLPAPDAADHREPSHEGEGIS
jgi:hypothetical protein